MKNLILCGLSIFFFGISLISVHPHDADTHSNEGEENQRPWAEHLETFQKLLKTDPDAARGELQNIAEHVFSGHVLTEEWVPLYFRVKQQNVVPLSSHHISDIKRIFELEMRMLMDIDAEKYAKQIQQSREALKYYTELPALSGLTGDPPKKTSPPEQELYVSEATQELYAIAEQHLTNFRELLPTENKAAVAELDTYTALMFENHPLIEEWQKIYIPIVRNQGGLLPEIIRLVELEKQMLTETDAQKHKKKIKTLESIEESTRFIAKMFQRQGILDTKFVPFTFE